MAQGDVTRITAQFTSSSGDIFQWVWHYLQSSSGSPTAEEIGTAAAALLALVWAELDSFIHTSISGDVLLVQPYDAVAGEFNTEYTADISSLAGTSSASSPANYQDAPIIKFFTAVGRSIGKKFLFGLVVNAFNGQSPSNDLLTAMALAALEWYVDITAGGATLSPGNFNVGTGTFREWIDTVAINLLTGTQDRRRRGIGL